MKGEGETDEQHSKFSQELESSKYIRCRASVKQIKFTIVRGWGNKHTGDEHKESIPFSQYQ